MRLNQENTPDSILRTAKALFSRQGYAKTSVRQICSEAGVNLSLVNYHFGSKEDLYRQCLKSIGSRYLDFANSTLKPSPDQADFKVRIHFFVEQMITSHAEDYETNRLINRELEENSALFSDLLKETFLETLQKVATYLGSAQRKGFIRKDLDPLTLANILYGMIAYQVQIDDIREKQFQRTIRETSYRERLANQISSIFLEGIC